MMSKFSGDKSIFGTQYQTIPLTLRHRIASLERFLGGKNPSCYHLIHLADLHRF